MELVTSFHWLYKWDGDPKLDFKTDTDQRKHLECMVSWGARGESRASNTALQCCSHCTSIWSQRLTGNETCPASHTGPIRTVTHLIWHSALQQGHPRMFYLSTALFFLPKSWMSTVSLLVFKLQGETTEKHSRLPVLNRGTWSPGQLPYYNLLLCHRQDYSSAQYFPLHLVFSTGTPIITDLQIARQPNTQTYYDTEKKGTWNCPYNTKEQSLFPGWIS